MKDFVKNSLIKVWNKLNTFLDTVEDIIFKAITF